MNPDTELSLVVDGFSLEVKLEEPLPPGFRLLKVLSGESALAAIKAEGPPDFVAKLKEQICAYDTRPDMLIASYSYLGPTEFVTLVAVPGRKDAITHYVFTFGHPGDLSREEVMPIAQEVISSVFMYLNWAKADEGERTVMIENQAMKYLSPDELEKLADAEQTISDTPRLRERLVEEIRARVWEPEKSAEPLAQLTGSMAQSLPVPAEHVDEIAQKLRAEDIDQFAKIAADLKAAEVTRCEILNLGTTRDYEDHSQ